MADKDSTLIIEVDLACNTCCTKIQKVLCKIQANESIKNISYDTKKNMITISGSFNPHHLYHKLRCKAGWVIKGHKIPDNEAAEKKKKEEAEKKKKEEEEKKKKEEAEKKKKKEEEEAKKKAAAANTTVNLRFTQVCVICYPWPCSDPVGHCQQRHCDGVPAANHHHQRPPPCGGVPPKCSTCPGPPRCGGCGSCGGGGGWWQPPPLPLPPNCCPGPSCRGCMGCRVVHEQKYEYHEYPPSACVVM